MSDKRLAVVTVTYSPGRYLEEFLASIPDATEREVLVIMADNGSTDGAPEAAVDLAPNPGKPVVELLRTGGNLGYGTAINRAVAALAGREDVDPEAVLVANPDVVWGPGSIDTLLEALRRHPCAGTVGPLIREADGSAYPSARAVPELLSGAGHALFGTVWPSNPWTRRYLDDEDMARERTAGWLSGSCLAVRRSAFEEIGGFDERYFMYMEDVDFGDRLGRAGYKNVFVPAAEIRHAKGHAAGEHPEKMLPAHHASAYRFQADRHPKWWQAPLRWALRGGLAVRSRVAVAAARRRRA